jgi:hypothetical protein
VEVCPLRTRPAQAVNFCLACPHACAACSGEKCSACISGISFIKKTVNILQQHLLVKNFTEHSKIL